MRSRILSIALMCVATPAFAGDIIPAAQGGRTYVQYQIERAKSNHPEIASIIVTGVRDASEGEVILGSTLSPTMVFQKTNVANAASAVSASSGLYRVSTAYVSRTNRPIGTIEFRFYHRKRGSVSALNAVAEKVTSDLARSTYSAKNAIDPYPLDPSIPANTFAQKLATQFTVEHPEIVVMMIHAKAPGSDRNIVVGSNVGRIGKLADEDDLRVADQGENNVGLNADGDQYETEVPLFDAQRRRIGALGLVFAYQPGDDKSALLARGLKFRDQLAPMIPSQAALFVVPQ